MQTILKSWMLADFMKMEYKNHIGKILENLYESYCGEKVQYTNISIDCTIELRRMLLVRLNKYISLFSIIFKDENIIPY